MRIAPELMQRMIDHARAEAPNECCGMIACDDGRAIDVHAAVNAAASPLRYEIEPRDQYRIQMAIEDAGLQLGAIYHSHTRSEPYPSQTDINLATYPDAVYIIIGVASPEPEVRAYRITAGGVDEVELEVDL